MKKKLFMALLLLLVLASCNKKKVSKETNISNTEIKERGLSVGAVTGFDLLPMFSPANYFVNNHNIPWSLSVVSLDFTGLVQNTDLFASKQYKRRIYFK